MQKSKGFKKEVHRPIIKEEKHGNQLIENRRHSANKSVNYYGSFLLLSEIFMFLYFFIQNFSHVWLLYLCYFAIGWFPYLPVFSVGPLTHYLNPFFSYIIEKIFIIPFALRRYTKDQN